MLRFDWNGKELIIKQCNKMKTHPHECETCSSRFICFTERTKYSDAEISSASTQKLSDILKELENVNNRTTDS